VSQDTQPLADILHTALEITERVLRSQNVLATADARVEITMAVYELIQEGRGIEAAERTVTRMLRAVSGVAPKTV
jgi:hypothetical protein